MWLGAAAEVTWFLGGFLAGICKRDRQTWITQAPDFVAGTGTIFVTMCGYHDGPGCTSFHCLTRAFPTKTSACVIQVCMSFLQLPARKPLHKPRYLLAFSSQTTQALGLLGLCLAEPTQYMYSNTVQLLLAEPLLG
jgi:hypothetical protein